MSGDVKVVVLVPDTLPVVLVVVVMRVLVIRGDGDTVVVVIPTIV